MSVEDKMLSIKVRHAVARSAIDISELIVTSSRGMVEMNGKVKKLGKNAGGEISLEKEFRRAVDVARGVPGVKDIVAERVRIQD